MNYHDIYKKLIDFARIRTILPKYTETHHIIPKAMGGTDEKNNLVELSGREHFIAHLLLAKMYPLSGMIHAAHMMSNMKRYNSKKYEWLKILHAKKTSLIQTGRTHTEDAKDKMRGTRGPNINKRPPFSESHRKAIADSKTGVPLSDSCKEKLSLVFSGVGNPMYGKTHTEESRNIISLANKQKISCPHCGIDGGIAIMKRWHFEYCKKAPVVLPRYKSPILTCPHCGKVGGGARMISLHMNNCKHRSNTDEN